MDLRTADVDDALVFTPPGNEILETSFRFEASVDTGGGGWLEGSECE
jgi:hypothetical protein